MFGSKNASFVDNNDFFFANAVANEQRMTFDGREYVFGIRLVDYEQAKQRCADIQLQLVAIYTAKIQNFCKTPLTKV